MPSPRRRRCFRSASRSSSSTAGGTTSFRPRRAGDYAAAAEAAGDAVDLVELLDADHFDVIEATHPAWAVVVAWLHERLQP